MTQFSDRVFQSLKWSVLANLLPRAITPTTTLVLAALLSPEDFGISAAATLVIAFGQIVASLGIGTALVQHKLLDQSLTSTAFIVSTSMSLLTYGTIWVTAPIIAMTYSIPTLTFALRIAGSTIIFSALSSIPQALLQRQFEFKKLFLIQITAQLASAIASLAFALLGFGVWALILGPVLGQAVNTVTVYTLHSWRPTAQINTASITFLFTFSFWILLSSFQTWLFLYGDNALAGHYLGSQGLGEYSLGFNISNLLPGMIITPLASVAYPVFCALQSQGEFEIGRNLLKTQAIAASVVLPLSFGLSAMAIPLTTLMYGDKWPDLGWIIHWLSILPGISHLWSLNADAYRAVGHPEAWVRIAGLTLVIMLLSLIVVGNYGVRPFVIARFASMSLFPLLHLIMTRRLFRISIKTQLFSIAPSFGCAFTVYLFTNILTRVTGHYEGAVGWLKISGIFISGAILYIALLKMFHPSLYKSALYCVNRVLGTTS